MSTVDRGSVTSPPYAAAVDYALTRWLMTPGAPDAPLSLEDLLQRPAWHAEAACRGHGPADYVKGNGADYGATRALCAACPVREECLAVALADRNIEGLWGGTDERERKALRKTRAA